jgi:uncharacterized protein YunC (DUF1805 family)
MFKITDSTETIDCKTANWFKVRTIAGNKGYVFCGYLEIK